jgi:hypothetical protein
MVLWINFCFLEDSEVLAFFQMLLVMLLLVEDLHFMSLQK